MFSDPAVEHLEPRRLLAARLTAADTLLIEGSDAADAITVRQAGAQLDVHLDDQTTQFPRADARRIRILGGDGDDRIFARDGRRDTLRGGAGADRATADTVGGVIDLISEVEEVS